MNKAILFNFLVDKENKQIKVERSFDAPISLVWAAWTEAEILDQWWAPAPWKARTSSMDFREGGRWFYAMVSPDGSETHWCLLNYRKIQPNKYFVSEDAFANERGEVNPEMPSNEWETRFNEGDENTIVNVTMSFKKLEDLEQIIQMGFREGFTQGLDQLDQWLKKKQGGK